MRETYLFNTTKGQPAGSHIAVADTAFSRLIGLMGKRRLEAGHGLWIKPSSGVHTFGMRFPIDVVALDGNLRVAGLWPRLRPFRFSGIGFKIRSVLEFPAGQIALDRIELGDRLEEYGCAHSPGLHKP